MKLVSNHQCRMCQSRNLEEVIDFGVHPLVNSLVEEKDLSKAEDVFPLKVNQCQDCFLVQVSDIIDAHEIYKNVDYLYFSSDMPGLDQYFRPYAEELRKLVPSGLVVEIGANDGLMLGMFEGTHAILGVDPASNVVVRALKKEIPILSDFFSERIANSIKREFRKASLIYGNNCIAHLNDLRGIMNGVVSLLDEEGVFAVECNYWGAMVENKNYSLIYHDHFSYFSLLNWVNFCKEYGLEVFDAYVTPAQGGSLRVLMDFGQRKPTQRFNDLLDSELASELNSLKTVKKYDREIKEEAIKLHKLVASLKDEGKTIAGYGCAAKGLSVLKFAGIDQRHIDYFVDDSPAKQGKFTPVTHIPIISREEAKSKLPDYFFITAPNYESVIIAKEQEFVKNGGKFITTKSEIK